MSKAAPPGRRDLWFGLLSVSVLVILLGGLVLRVAPDVPVRLGLPLERSWVPLGFLDYVGVILLLLFLYAAIQRGRSAQLVGDVAAGHRQTEEMRLELAELQSIFEVSSRIPTIHDLEEALRFVVHAALGCLEADRTSLFLLEGETLYARAVEGKMAEELAGTRLRLGEGICGWVALHHRSLLLNGQEDVRRFFPEGIAERGIASALCVPLSIGEKTVGVLNVSRLVSGDGRPFEDRQRRLLSIFADYAAGTIRHLRMYGDLSAAHQRLTTAHRRAEELQNQLVQSEKLSALGQLIGEVAHELNGPLASTIGFAQLLARENRDPTIAGHLGTIRAEGMRCQKIVANLLNFVRRNRGEQTPVDVNRLIRETVELRAHHLRSSSIEVDLDLEEGVPPVLADATRLQQVFFNLLNNAVQAIEELGRPGRVRFESRFLGSGRVLVVRVSDTGPGIPSGSEERIFEPFYTTKAAGKGTGLGLPVCRGILEELGGRLELTSPPGAGATFTLTMPALDGAATIPDAPAEASMLTCGGVKILVVDDEAALAELLRITLELDGHLVATAAGVDAAMETARKLQFDVVMTDFYLPDGDGLALLARLREERPAMAGRLMFLTGSMGDPDVRRRIEATGRPVIGKPFALEEVRAAVKSVVRGR